MALKGSVFATRARAGSSKLATQYDADGNEIEVLWNLTDDWFCYQNSIHKLFAGQEHTHPYIPLVVPVQSNVLSLLAYKLQIPGIQNVLYRATYNINPNSRSP